MRASNATPKNKTLEMFGDPLPADAQGKVKHRPFHHYSMKQAVQERFILDVVSNSGSSSIFLISL